ncbi:dihydrodipicolinate synthase [mine drainage metagenome]|uniref:4-hydroxy-tetrahydrodipicolinate synthase n=1 Tax=mine drainage metagenome TaxID=410659 RepID=T1BC56_9ZZZZ
MAQSGEIDYTSLGRLVDWHVASGTAALVVAGTTGESSTLQPVEQVELVQAVQKMARGRVPVIAGSGCHGTEQTVRLTRRMAELGVQACLLVTPYYNKPGQEGLYQHFQAVARAVSVPLILYNVPSRTACDLLPETVARLNEYPHIVGIKEATPGSARLRALRKVCRPDFCFWSGDDLTALDFIQGGGHGVISVTANVVPELMSRWIRHALAGEWPEATSIQNELTPLHQALFVESNPIPVKWALEAMGYIPGGIRLPLTRLGETAQPIVRAALEHLNVWMERSV